MKGLYPADWSDIARATKERALWRCEACKAPHGAWGTRGRRGSFITVDPAEMAALGHGKPPFRRRLSRGGYVKVVAVVLSACHLDGHPPNCDPENLAALCQHCHLAHDMQQHVRSAHATRRAAMATGDLF